MASGWATSPPGSGGASRGAGQGFGLTGAPNHLDSIKQGWDYHPEEHRNLPPTGLPSSVQTLAASGSASPPGSFSSTQPLLAPASPAAPGGSNVRISVPQLFDGRLGLIIQNCWISAISNPQAAQYGWQVGDHILQVNGHPVSNMQQLSEEIRRAMNSHQAVSHPLIFDVFRSSAAPLSAPATRKERCDCCNVCDFTDSAAVSGYGGPIHAPPAYGGPMPAPQVARKQRFECCGADGANGTLPTAAAPPAATPMQAPCAPCPGMVPRRRALC